MQKLSTISIRMETREGYPGKIVYANVLIDGIPLTDYKEIGESNFVTCLGWGTLEYQKQEIARLLLKSEADLNNRNSLSTI